MKQRDDHIMPDFHYSPTPGLMGTQKKASGGGMKMPRIKVPGIKIPKSFSGSLSDPKIKKLSGVKAIKVPNMKNPVVFKESSINLTFKKPGKNRGG